MMPKEKQVCALEQAIEFERLGMTAESLDVWRLIGDPVLKTKTWVIEPRKNIVNILCDHYSAYSCAELDVLLSQIRTHYLMVVIDHLYDARLYKRKPDEHEYFMQVGETGTRVKAKLLLQAIRKKIIKPKDLKL